MEDNRLYTTRVRFEEGGGEPKHSRNKREDPDAIDGSRFVTLGLSAFGNLLVVVYTYRGTDVIRLISAWKANRRQGMQYEKGRR